MPRKDDFSCSNCPTSESNFRPFFKNINVFTAKSYTYSRENFIENIRELEETKPHPENKLLLTIFEFSNLDPYEFVKALNLYDAHGPRDFFTQVISQFRKFKEFKTFNKILNFISKFIFLTDERNLSMQLLDDLFRLRFVAEAVKLTDIAEYFLQFTEDELEFLTELGCDVSRNPNLESSWYKNGKWFWLDKSTINLYYQSVLAPYFILNPKYVGKILSN